MRFFTGRNRKGTAFAVISLVVLGAAGVTLAQTTDTRPRTDRVSATFYANVVDRETKTCQGQDGFYGELVKGTFVGESTGDPRLTGVLTVHGRALLRTNPDIGVPPDPNLGTTQGHFTIQQGGQVVAEGELYGTIEGTQARIEGFAVGRTNRVQQEDRVFEAGTLLGHFRAFVDQSGNFSTGTFGLLDTEPSDPMVVQHGSCEGPTQPEP